MEDNEENSGIKFVWNNLPLNRTDSTIITIPLGFHYQPAKIIEDLPIPGGPHKNIGTFLSIRCSTDRLIFCGFIIISFI